LLLRKPIVGIGGGCAREASGLLKAAPLRNARNSLRAERDSDRPFLYRLFCDSRLPELALLAQQVGPLAYEQIMRMQFQAQITSYHAQFAQARFDIVELREVPTGRIVVERPGDMVHIVDLAIVPSMRNRGIGTAMMRTLMDEAAQAELPVRLKVASSNDPSMRLYLRLGFVPIETAPLYIEMEWRATAP
jgi:ribosomal protein S18 acetylase RimI-like enzyme